MDTGTLWRAALADAEIDEGEAVLFEVPMIQSSGGYLGMTWLRGTPIDQPNECEVLGARLAEANREPALSARRVMVCTQRTPEGVAAAMRHELEHSRQYDAYGYKVIHLYHRAQDVLGDIAAGLPQGGKLYNAIPVESDANAAAAMFARSLFGDARIDALVDAGDMDAALFRPRQGPQPMDSLLDRMRGFILTDGPRLARTFVEQHEREHGPRP